MDTVWKVVGLAMVAACCCMVLRSQTGVLAMALSLLVCALILGATCQLFQPVLQVLDTLRSMSGLEEAVTAPVLKVMGIGFVSQIAVTVCEDTGEKALGQAVEVGCSILALYVTLPLISAVLQLLKDILGGAS